ncbi:MAG: GAF domain-containing protein [Chloroflexi bacterium]|nr:GAF domain-containing protein [Chloroflexota bacterium]
MLAIIRLYELGRVDKKHAAALADMTLAEFDACLETFALSSQSVNPTPPALNHPPEPIDLQKQLFANLVAVNRAITSRISLSDTLQNVMDIAMKLTRAKEAGLFLVDTNGRVTYSIFSSHINTIYHDRRYIGLIMDKGLAGWVLRHKQMALVTDTELDDRWLDLPGDEVIHRSALVIPITNNDPPLGILTLTHPDPFHFDQDDAAFMRAAADQIALALYNAQIYEDQRRQTERLNTLYTVLQTVGAHLDPNTAVEAAVKKVAELTGWPAVTISLPEETQTYLINIATSGTIAIAHSRRRIANQGITGRAFRTQQTQYVPDVSADPDYYMGHPSVRSEMAVPLRSGRYVLGVFDVASDKPYAFEQQDITLAESLAETIALALNNARLYAETQRRLLEQTTLRQANSLISSTLDLSAVFQLIAEQLGQATDVTSVYVCDFDPTREQATVLAEFHNRHVAAEKHRSHLHHVYNLAHFAPGTIEALIQGRVQVMHLDDPALDPMIRQELEMDGGISVLNVPFQIGGQTLAYAALRESRYRRVFSQDEISLCLGIAQHAAIAMRHAQLFRTIAEERGRLQTLIESSRDGLILIGVNQDILVMNELALHMLLVPSQAEQWIGRSTGHLILHLRHLSPGAAHMLLSETRRIISGNEPPSEGEFDVQGRTIQWLNLPVMSEETTMGRLFVLRDITKDRLVENMRKDLIRTMIHDFRNPLTAITGTVQLLELGLHGSPNATQRQLFDVTYSTLQKMLHMVNSIMEINQLQSDQFPLDYEMFSLEKLVEEGLELQRPLAITRGITLSISMPSSLPVVWADRTLIERTLRNLVGNALKFTPTGGKVQVTVREIDALRGKNPTWQKRLLVETSDTGAGIPPALRDRLFQKFAAGTQRERGHGLGLAFCKMAIEAHGEQIWFDEHLHPPFNTTFAFTVCPFSEGKDHANRH